MEFHRGVAAITRENLGIKASGASRARSWDERSMRQGITDTGAELSRLQAEQRNPEGGRQRNLTLIGEEIARSNVAINAHRDEILSIMGE